MQCSISTTFPAHLAGSFAYAALTWLCGLEDTLGMSSDTKFWLVVTGVYLWVR